MTDFYGTPNTNNNFIGGPDSDNFFFPVGYLNASDVLQGNGGIDTLTFQSTGTIDAGTLGGVTGIERYQLGNGSNLFSMSDGRAALNGGLITILANNGNDSINMSALTSAANRADITAGLGNDTLRGSANADVFRFAATALTASDLVQGKGGFDTLILTAAGAASLAGVSEIEAVQFAAGGISLTINDAIANANAATLGFTGSAGNDLVDASAVTLTNRSINVTAGGGNDTLRGGAGVDNFSFSLADLTASDVVQGNGGTDTVQFLSSGVVGAATLAGVSGVERYLLANGSNFFSMSDGRASLNGGRIIVVGNAGNDNIDMAQLVSAGNRADITAGGGNDALRGSAGADIFRSAANQLTGADTVRGNAGLDTIEFSTAGAIGASALSTVTEVERYVLANGSNTFSMSDGRATLNGGLITIVGNSGNDAIDMAQLGSAGNRVDITAGGGTDTLRGSSGDDIFRFAASDLNSADTVNGNSGTDTLILTTAGNAALGGVSGIETLQLAVGEIILTNAGIPGGTLNILGSSGNDTVYAGGSVISTNIFTAGAGKDRFEGGAGHDIVRFGTGELTSADVIAGADVIQFTAPVYLPASTFGNVSGIGRFELAYGTNFFQMSPGRANLNGGRVVVIGNDGDDTVSFGSRGTFDGGSVDFTAGAGNDYVIGSEADDIIRFRADELNQFDNIVAGDGIDTLILTTPGSLENSYGIENIILADGDNFVTLAEINYSIYNTTTILGGSGNDMIDVSGSAHYDRFANIAAGTGEDIVLGSGGDDSLDGGASNDVIHGNGGDDLIIGGTGSDILYGEGGTDTFHWAQRDTGTDTLNDFNVSDTLSFERDVFDFSGAAFDTRLVAGSSATNIDGADLIIYTGGNLNSIADVDAYLDAANGGNAGEGAFIIGTRNDGNAALYHVTDASGGAADIQHVATFGPTMASVNFQLSDFLFI